MSPRALSKDALLLACVFGLACPGPSARGQMISITAESPSAAADDLIHLVKAVMPDDPRSAAVIDLIERQLRAVAGLPGFDGKSPIRAIINLPDQRLPGQPPTVVAAVQVTDFAKFMKSLGGMNGVTVDDDPGAPGFSHKVTVAGENLALFTLESGGLALFSMAPDGAEQIKKLKGIDPASWRPAKGARPSVLNLTLRLSEVPRSFKDQYLNVLEAARKKDAPRQPGETGSQYAGRILGQNLVIWSFERLVRDGATMSIDLALDREANGLSAELMVSAPPDTPTAKALGALKGRSSRFHVLSENAAIALEINLPIAEPVRDAISGIIDQAPRSGTKAGGENQNVKRFLDRLARYLKTNVAAPEIEMGLAMHVTERPGAGADLGRAFGAVKAKDVPECDRLFREFAEEVKKEKAPVVIDTTGSPDGTVFHRLDISKSEFSETTARYFGETPSLCIAYGGDAIWCAFGKDSLPPLRAMVEKSARPALDVESVPVCAVIHAAPLGRLFRLGPEAFRRVADEVFQGADAKHDRIRLTLREDGGAARLRLAVDLPVLKAIVKLGGWGGL